MNFGRRNVVQQKSNNASALYAPTLGRYGKSVKFSGVVKRFE